MDEKRDETRSDEERGPRVHTSPEEDHPSGEGERTDRDIGGPTSPDDEPEEDIGGAGRGTKPTGLDADGLDADE